MTDRDIEALADRPEGPRLERKLELEPKVMVRHVAAMLNSGGGTLMIGVDRDGRLVGVADPGRTQGRIKKALSGSIHPRGRYSIRRVPVEADREVIVIDVPAGSEGPYAHEDGIFIRDGATTRLAQAEEVTRLIREASQRRIRWETQPALGVELGNLDRDEILLTATRAGRNRLMKLGDEPAEILRRLHLMQDDQVTNGAVALFAHDPSRWLPQTRIRVARFEGGGTTSAIDQRVLTGNVFELLEGLEAFLSRHLSIRVTTPKSGYQREEQPALPRLSLREALLNALAHRDYAAYSGGIRLGVWDDRLELWNSGTLPEEIAPEELSGSHASRPRNPNIAHVLFLRGLVEGWGIGTTRIAQGLRELGLPPPIWRHVSGGTELVMRLTALATSELLPRERRLLDDLEPGKAIRAREYEQTVADDVSSRQARADLKKLVDAGYLLRRGRGRATMYVRTAKRSD